MGNFLIKKNNNNCSNDTNDTKYWKYYGILIPYNIKSIPSIDGINIIGSRGGTETLADIVGDYTPAYTLREYQKKYARRGIDGKLYWKQ